MKGIGSWVAILMLGLLLVAGGGFWFEVFGRKGGQSFSQLVAYTGLLLAIYGIRRLIVWRRSRTQSAPDR